MKFRALPVRCVLGTLLAVALSRICAALGTKLWMALALWAARVTRESQVALDTMALAIPLAARSVAQAAGLLSLPPIFLACWAAAYPASRRFLAAGAGLGAGALVAIMWQNLISLKSGYAFSLRHALPQPVTPMDAFAVILIGVLEAWVTLRMIPIREKGGLRKWLSRTDGPDSA
jgi:hypothetical protein